MSQLNFRENLVENTTVYLSSLGYSVKRIDIKVSDGDVHVFLEMPIEATKNATVIEYNLRKFFNQMPDIFTIVGLTLIISGVLIVNILGKTN